ncbi:hypothetical protein G6F63_014474 [Rhizopus arrhizus]|nr:hypothetical protein G6F63_014474 [Rhizopus arrhizus]
MGAGGAPAGTPTGAGSRIPRQVPHARISGRRPAGAVERSDLGVGRLAPLCRRIADQAVGDGADDGAGDRRNPEQPQLLYRPTAHEQRRPSRTSRIHRRIRDGNADQVNQRQRQPDRDGRKAGRRALGRGAKDHE